MAWYRITGPKGGLIVRRASAARVKAIISALRARYGAGVKVTTLPKTEAEIRQGIVSYCRWGIANEPSIHYKQARPIPLKKCRSLPLTTDCSGFATCAYFDAGAPDPNGNGYDGTGYTGTLLAHGIETSRRAAKPGDLVIFGPGTGHHVCVVLESGNDPLLASHGVEAGPFRIRYSEEMYYQPPPVRWLTYFPKEGNL